MVDIASAISSAATANSSSASVTGGSSVTDNFDTFLSLLTTQLKNQDPSNPLDTNQFTQQLIQYTEVEQLLQSNKKLEALVNLSSANTSVSLINYVGKEVTTKGKTVELADGNAKWGLDVPSGADNVTYVIKDENNNEVFSQTGSLEAGNQSFSWDGTTSSGAAADKGNYSLTVTATDAAGESVAIDISTKGVVDGVDMTGDSPVLLIGSATHNVDDVLKIHTVD